MKKFITILVLLLLPIALLPFPPIPLASASNPFTTKPEKQHTAPGPAFKNKIFVKIITWQYQLKEKMTYLIRQAKATDSIRPLFFLIIAAFIYGVIHAAGPGHGKAITLSYVLSQRPSYIHGILFGNFIALFHGVSGIVFVLLIRVVLNTSIINNLEHVTRITQIISYSIISCLGLGIFINSLYKLIKNDAKNQRNFDNRQNRQYVNPILSAFVVGCIPCPGVVMVMLFALSLDLIGLGIILGIMISMGMALTMSIVVLIAISGKVASFNIAKKNKTAILVEHSIETFAGAALATIGLLLLFANI
jgi:ABC-type nickel/cobalt efflux system permease component RcnA